MSEKIKRYLAIGGIITLLCISYGVIKLANSYSASVQPSSFRSFAVSALGKATSIPDVAKFSFSVVTEGGKNIKDLTDKNNTKVDEIMKFLKGSKVDKSDIKTTTYSVEPRTQYYSCTFNTNGLAKPCPPSEIVGYTIRQSAEVKVKDFSTIGDILNGVVVKGANNVSDLQFTNDDPTKIEDDARADAIKKAIEKANGVAIAGGFRLGRLISIEEADNYYAIPRYESFAATKVMDGGILSPTPSIEPGSQETKVNVTLRYEIR